MSIQWSGKELAEAEKHLEEFWRTWKVMNLIPKKPKHRVIKEERERHNHVRHIFFRLNSFSINSITYFRVIVFLMART